MITEGLEQTSRLLALSEETQEALRKVCEEYGVKYDDFQAAMANLYALCCYTVEQIVEAMEHLKAAICTEVVPALQALSDNFRSLYNPEELFFMVPPHIKHLAYNHPKSRVRNKNWNRMWRIRKRYLKCHKQ